MALKTSVSFTSKNLSAITERFFDIYDHLETLFLRYGDFESVNYFPTLNRDCPQILMLVDLHLSNTDRRHR